MNLSDEELRQLASQDAEAVVKQIEDAMWRDGVSSIVYAPSEGLRPQNVKQVCNTVLTHHRKVTFDNGENGTIVFELP